MHHQQDLSRGIINVDDDLVNQDPDNALLQVHVRRRVVSECWQVLGEGLQSTRIDLLRRDRPRVETRQPHLLLTDAFQRGVLSRAPRNYCVTSGFSWPPPRNAVAQWTFSPLLLVV
jgi:hypothetical protein